MFDGIKVLVTGCSGFLGPWLCERLVVAGAQVLGADLHFDLDSRIHDVDPEKLDPVFLDVENIEELAAAIEESEVEFVFHLAAQSLVGEARIKPLETIATNVMGTANVLEVARQLRGTAKALRGVVVASSDKAYGEHDDLPFLESTPLRGRYPYDASKSCADLIAQSYAATYELAVAIARCGNLYGAGDLNWSRIVPGTFKHCFAGERPVIRSDGTLVRDYIYVEDAAQAFVTIGGALMAREIEYGEAFNVSGAEHMTVLEIVRKIQEAAGVERLEPVIENTAQFEINKQYLSSQHLRNRLGWKPQVKLSRGLALASDWYRKQCREETR
jgi:CDP-glucose 4,6-dehydratase